MVEPKKMGIVALILAFMASLGVNVGNYVNDEGVVIDEGFLPYTCAKEDIPDYYCYKLSKVGTTGVNRNCYYDRERGKKYKVCSTGWQLKTSLICPETTCPEKECPIVEELTCPYVPPCKVCEEPKECPEYGGGGGGGGSCPACNSDGTTVCTEIIGFVLVPNEGTYYCKNCGTGGCDDCILDNDIMLPFDMTPYKP